MSRDPRAERIAARAEAEKARAQAETIRVQAAIEHRRAKAELNRDQDAERRRRALERRRALTAAARRNGDLALPVLAVGSPALIAWRGQFEFALRKMDLGLMAPLLPVAIEGSVLYSAYLTHKAVAEALPAGRYRALTWTLAGVAAGMNFWHGSSAGSREVGTALAITSLLSIVLLELTIALRKAREGKARTGRGAAEIRQALIRRIRYPLLSVATAALAAARGIDADEAWRAAWADRYGVGPEHTRRERRAGRRILRAQRRADKAAARAGELVIADGTIVRAAGTGGTGDALADSFDTQVRIRAAGGIADMERWLADRPGEPAARPGTVAEPPPAGPAHPADGQGGRSVQVEPTQESPSGKRSRARKTPVRKGGRGRRLESVRRLLQEDPGLSGADIAARLGIPESTARRLAKRAREEKP